MLAVVRLREDRRLALLAPDLVARSPGMLPEVRVPFLKVAVERRLGVVQRLVVAVVDDRAGHATEDGLDHVEELSARRQRRGLDDRTTATVEDGSIVLMDALEQPLGDVPRGAVPGE